MCIGTLRTAEETTMICQDHMVSSFLFTLIIILLKLEEGEKESFPFSAGKYVGLILNYKYHILWQSAVF